eukprot:1336445-Amphidinium_carterae.1
MLGLYRLGGNFSPEDANINAVSPRKHRRRAKMANSRAIPPSRHGQVPTSSYQRLSPGYAVSDATQRLGAKKVPKVLTIDLVVTDSANCYKCSCATYHGFCSA